MANHIHILPESVINRIAAGEVIERPASVVKELIENAIDAHATEIIVHLKGGGLELIHVIDNGDGMSEEDALICMQKHATSKISDVEDLEKIDTFGFRGEALASMGEVARLVITTRPENAAEATEVYFENGKIQEVLKKAAAKGTSIAVKDLFAFFPARRKFLKTPNTELRYAVAVVRRMALAHPEIGFTLFIEDAKSFEIPPQTLEERIACLWGEEKSQGLVPMEKTFRHLSIRGFVSKPRFTTRTREEQFLFLNKRYIVSKTLHHAIVSAYGNTLPPGEFPLFIIFLTLSPQYFDVNVHPQKIEVRFSDERFLYEMVRKSIEALLRTPKAIPELQLISSGRKNLPYSRQPKRGLHPGQLSLTAIPPDLNAQSPLELAYQKSFLESQMQRVMERETPLLWQVHNRYILSQIKSGLAFIDQHVAHERILYEKALKSMEIQNAPSQQLLFPTPVFVSPEDMLALIEILPYLKRIGFGIQEFGKNTVLIESVPMDIKIGREKPILLEMIALYKETDQTKNVIKENVAKVYACSSAIKAGEKLSPEEMASLVDQLFATENPYFCPHGRPIVITLTLEELDKRFGRE